MPQSSAVPLKFYRSRPENPPDLLPAFNVSPVLQEVPLAEARRYYETTLAEGSPLVSGLHATALPGETLMQFVERVNPILDGASLRDALSGTVTESPLFRTQTVRGEERLVSREFAERSQEQIAQEEQVRLQRERETQAEQQRLAQLTQEQRAGTAPATGAPNVSRGTMLSEQDLALINTMAEIAPDYFLSQIQISPEDIQGFLSTAQAEVEPFYAQQIRQAKDRFESELSFQKKQEEARRELEALQSQVEQEKAATSFAESGLATSGVRRKAEERMRLQQESVARSRREQFARGVEQFGRGVEDVLGSQTVAGFESRGLYSPLGGVRGSLERERTTAEQTRASELERQERIRELAALVPDAPIETLLNLSS